MEIGFLVGLIIFNGLLAMSEVSLLTAKRSRLSAQAAAGKKSAALALRISENPTQFLSAIQIGITSIGLLSGIVGESIFAEPLGRVFAGWGVDAALADLGATILVVIVVTYFSIIIGELVPKRIGQSNPEAIASAVSAPMLAMTRLTMPFVWALSQTTNFLLRLFGIAKHKPATVTEDEIEAILEEGSLAGLIEHQEKELVKNVFRLDDRQLGELMVPRSDIVFVDLQASDETNLEKIAESVHSRIPVCDGDLNKIVGVLTAKSVLAKIAKGGALSIREDLKEPLFVPESLTGMDLLERFKSSATHVAFVVDEYGEIEGLVTLQDIFDSLVGDFAEGESTEPSAVRRDDGSWLLDGTLPIPELKDILGLEHVPDEDKGRYHTLSGLLLLILGNIPSTGDSVQWEGWQLEVIDMDGKRIDKVLAKPN